MDLLRSGRWLDLLTLTLPLAGDGVEEEERPRLPPGLLTPLAPNKAARQLRGDSSSGLLARHQLVSAVRSGYNSPMVDRLDFWTLNRRLA